MPFLVLVLEIADHEPRVEQGVPMVVIEALLPEFVVERFGLAVVPRVTTALKMALWRRDHDGHAINDRLIHQSDAGSQYTAIAAFAETLVQEGIAASSGTARDAYDHTVAGTSSSASRRG